MAEYHGEKKGRRCQVGRVTLTDMGRVQTCELNPTLQRGEAGSPESRGSEFQATGNRISRATSLKQNKPGKLEQGTWASIAVAPRRRAGEAAEVRQRPVHLEPRRP